MTSHPRRDTKWPKFPFKQSLTSHLSQWPDALLSLILPQQICKSFYSLVSRFLILLQFPAVRAVAFFLSHFPVLQALSPEREKKLALARYADLRRVFGKSPSKETNIFRLIVQVKITSSQQAVVMPEKWKVAFHLEGRKKESIEE